VNHKDGEGNSCLHIAAAKGSNAILRILLNVGVKVSAKNNNMGMDPEKRRWRARTRGTNMGIDTYLIPEPMGTCVEMLWFWSQNPWEINSFLAFALSRVVGKG
jgi:hypothetical protein